MCEKGRSSGDTGRRAPDTGHRTPVTGHRSPVTRHRTPDTGHRTPGTGHRAPGTAHRGTGHMAAGSVHRAPDTWCELFEKIAHIREKTRKIEKIRIFRGNSRKYVFNRTSLYVLFKTLQLQLKYPFVQGSSYPGGEHPGEWLESVMDSPE